VARGEDLVEAQGVEAGLAGDDAGEESSVEMAGTRTVASSTAFGAEVLVGVSALEAEVEEEPVGEAQLLGGGVPAEGGELEEGLFDVLLKGGL